MEHSGTEVAEAPRRTWLAALGLHRPELRAWALYDVASAVVLDVVVTALFPAYFSEVAAGDAGPAAATARFAAATTAAMAVVAVLAPVLGAIADAGRNRKRMLAVFLAVGATAGASLFLVQRGDWLLGSILFAAVIVGTDGAAIFHAALLPHVARPDELDRTSTAACALGYVAAGLVLAVVVVAIERPAWVGLPAGPGLSPAQETLPVRLAFVAAAGWWALFSVPLLLRIHEPPGPVSPPRVRAAGSRLLATAREIRLRPDAWRFLGASLLYGSGISTIVRMAVVYGAEVGIDRRTMVVAIVGVDLVGTPFAFLFGGLAARVGAKRAIVAGLCVYTAAAVLGYFLSNAWQFLLIALLVATVQGGVQSLTRSVFASLVPVDRSAEFFGVSAMAGKMTGLVGPGLFALVVSATGSGRDAILSTVVLLVAGAALLRRVDVQRGGTDARASDLGQNASSTSM